MRLLGRSCGSGGERLQETYRPPSEGPPMSPSRRRVVSCGRVARRHMDGGIPARDGKSSGVVAAHDCGNSAYDGGTICQLGGGRGASGPRSAAATQPQDTTTRRRIAAAVVVALCCCAVGRPAVAQDPPVVKERMAFKGHAATAVALAWAPDGK